MLHSLVLFDARGGLGAFMKENGHVWSSFIVLQPVQIFSDRFLQEKDVEEPVQVFLGATMDRTVVQPVQTFSERSMRKLKDFFDDE